MDLVEIFDAFTFWLVNVSAGFMLSAAHNVLFFVLDLHTIVFHFLHFFMTFLFLLGRVLIAKRGRLLTKTAVSSCKSVLSAIYPAVLGQVVVTFLSSQVHSQNRSGELYLLRLFDFLATITALKMKSLVFGGQEDGRRSKLIWILLLPVALSGSLSWLEFGHIEYDSWTLLLAPFLAVAQGLQFLFIKKTYSSYCTLSIREGCGGFDEEEGWFEEFSLHLTGWMSVICFLPALASYSNSVVSHDAAWESIDHVLMAMSIVFMASYKYSELWMQTHIELHHYCVLEHSKFFVASVGQWFLQNMAHATIYAAVGKALFVASSFRYWSNFGGTWSKKESEA